MNAILEKMAGLIGEGFQTDSADLSQQRLNVFHRPVMIYNSPDLSFMSGFVSSGLRGSAFLYAHDLSRNDAQLVSIARNHLPLVIHVHPDPSGYSVANYYDALQNIRKLDCFQFVASSLQEHLYMQCLAHRIAELALMPVIIMADYQIDENPDIKLPDERSIIDFLGAVDEPIDVPTAGQEIIFGKQRRRIPNWFSFDLPVAMGMQKDGQAIAFEAAAHQKYFRAHLPQLIDQAFREFQESFGVSINPVHELAGRKSPYGVLSIGAHPEKYFVDLGNKFPQVDFISIHQVNPLPLDLLKDRIAGKKAITLLYPVSSKGDFDVFPQEVFKLLNNSNSIIFSGVYGSELSKDLLQLAIENMWARTTKKHFYLGIPFTKEHSNFPKHQILLQEIESHYPQIGNESIYSTGVSSESYVKNHDVPGILRRYQNRGPNYARLARFYDDTGFFYQNDERNELIADPFTALSLSPAASAGFADQSASREEIPAFFPARCNGCGECFVQCPHAAIPPVAIGIEPLLRVVSNIVTSKTMTTSRITPMIKNMARIAAKIIDGRTIARAADFLPDAFNQVAAQMKLEGDKLEVANSEFMAIMEELGDFPISITETFFHQPDLLQRGQGELFSLAIDPVACTGCGICVTACPENALEMVSEREADLLALKRNFHTWEILPDTSGDTIRRLQHDPHYSSLAAAMLSRNYYMTMTGGDSGGLASDAKKILHMITALAESVTQPKMLDQIKNIDAFIEKLSDNVHQKLSNALPREGIENLSDVLQDFRRRKIHLQEIMQHPEATLIGRFIDSDDLQRKAELIKDLKELKWVLTEGPTGVGRARFGILLAGRSLEWAAKYPNNHFTQPVFVHQHGSIANEALALFLGQLRYQLDYIKLIRRAELEARDKYDPGTYDIDIAELTWDKLSEDEKRSIAPVLVVLDQQYINENSWGELHKITSCNYPIKVVLLNDLCVAADFPVASLAAIHSGMISTISQKNAFVFQGGLGDPDHLFAGLMEGLFAMSPALLHIHVTNYHQQEGAKYNALGFGRLAIDTRALPLIKFNPDRKHDFLRGAIDLSGNRELKKNWVVEKVELSTNNSLEYPQSWADWAFSQHQWKAHFQLLPEPGAWEFVPNYLDLDAGTREDIVPVITRREAEGLKYYSVSAEVVKITEAVLDHWRTLQELSGVIYEFPQRLENEVTQRAKELFDIKLREIEEQHAIKLKEQENAQMQKVKEQLKDRLLKLAQMARNKMEN